MCDPFFAFRPCNPAVRRNGLLPISPLPTATTSNPWTTDGKEEFYEPWVVLLPTAAPVLEFRQDSSSDSGGAPTGPGSSGASTPVSDSGSDNSGSGSTSPPVSPSPPTSGLVSSASGSDSGSQSSDSSISSSTDVLSSSDSSDSSSQALSSSTTPPSSTPSSTSSSTSASSLSSSSATSSAPPTSSTSATSSSASPSPSPTPTSTPSQTSTSPPSTPTSSDNGSSTSPATTSSPPITNGQTSTITSVIVTDINGTSTTITSLIPTVLSQPSASPMSSSTRRAIITGSAIGGTALIIIIVALVIFCKRSNRLRLNYRKLRVFGHRQRDMLLDEDDDYELGDPPGMQRLSERYTDDPRAPSMHSRASSRTQGAPTFPVASIPGSSSPHLLGLRASESGSIFHEAVWPPPGEQSRLVDPLVAGSNSVDLGRIIGDVMGPSGSRVPSQPTAAQTAHQPSVAIATGVGAGAHSRQTSATRLLSSPSPYPADANPPEYNDDDRREYELELARAQSPDSQIYTSREGPLRVANAGPDSPSSVTFNHTPPGTPKVKNWLERSPKTPHKEPDDLPGPHAEEQVSMGEAL